MCMPWNEHTLADTTIRLRLECLTHVISAALHGDHLHCWVLNGCGAIAVLGLQRLVGHPLALNGENCQVLPLVLEQHTVANLVVI